MADNLIPLIPQTASATMTLDIDAAETAKTVDAFDIVSAKLLIDANGADAAPTYTVPVNAAVGQIVHIDVTSLNTDSESAAAVVKMTYKDATMTFDAAGEEATVMFTELGVVDVSDLFNGTATSAGVIA